MSETAQKWELEGTVFVACNCDYGCPCNFNALPTPGYCHGQWTWQVDRGRYGDVPLDGLSFTVAVKWPGAIHEGNGEGLILYDERADERQSEAIKTLVGGDVGGPWGILAWTWPKIDGPRPAAYEIRRDGVTWHVKAAEMLEVVSGPIRNPVTGAEVHPSAVLPEGIVFKQGDFGASSIYRVSNGISLEYSDKYTSVAPFEYSGP